MDKGRLAHRLYNDKEIGALIQRATELHEETLGTSEHNLSLAEVEHIAAELGLPPEHVRAAALELENRVPSDSALNLWGRPFSVDQTRVVEAEITEEQWEHLVSEIRRFTGSTGRVSETGRNREWSRSIKDGSLTIEKTHVTVASRGDHTSIHVRKYYGGGAFIAYMLALIVGAAAMGIGLDGGALPDLVNVAIAGAGGLGGLALVRALLSFWAKRQQQRLKRLADQLYRTLSTSAPQVAANEQAPQQISLPDIDEPAQHTVDERQRVRA